MSNTEYALRRIAVSRREVELLTSLVMAQITIVQDLSPSERAEGQLTTLRSLLDKLTL